MSHVGIEQEVTSLSDYVHWYDAIIAVMLAGLVILRTLRT